MKILITIFIGCFIATVAFLFLTLSSLFYNSVSGEADYIESEIVRELKQIKSSILEIEEYMEKIENHIANSTYQRVMITSYHPPSMGINSDENPKKTAAMGRPIPGYTLAISKELFHMGWFNEKIYIEGWGVGKATDRMKSSLKGKRIDICAPTLKEAKKIGIRKNVLAILLR